MDKLFSSKPQRSLIQKIEKSRSFRDFSIDIPKKLVQDELNACLFRIHGWRVVLSGGGWSGRVDRPPPPLPVNRSDWESTPHGPSYPRRLHTSAGGNSHLGPEKIFGGAEKVWQEELVQTPRTSFIHFV